MPHDHPGGVPDHPHEDEVPTLGDGPVRRDEGPTHTPGGSMLRRDRLLNPHRAALLDDDEEAPEDNRLIKYLLGGLVLFVAVDLLIVGYRFGWLGGGPPPAPPPEPAPIEAPKPKAKVMKGVEVKEGMSEGLDALPAEPAPAPRLIDPPEM